MATRATVQKLVILAQIVHYVMVITERIFKGFADAFDDYQRIYKLKLRSHDNALFEEKAKEVDDDNLVSLLLSVNQVSMIESSPIQFGDGPLPEVRTVVFQCHQT